jgi:flavin-dependent dehydrogenase
MLLARAGLSVRLLERSARLGDVVSGHLIKPAGFARLTAAVAARRAVALVGSYELLMMVIRSSQAVPDGISDSA